MERFRSVGFGAGYWADLAAARRLQRCVGPDFSISVRNPMKTPIWRVRWLWLVAVIFAAGGGYWFFVASRPPAEVPLQGQAEVPRVKKGTTYTIRSGDRISIRVMGHPERDLSPTVDGKGAVSVAEAMVVLVRGLTIADAEAALRAAFLTRFPIGDARVVVTVDGYAPIEVTVGGQVRKPGRYSLQIDSTKTLRDLLFTAGGGTEMAKLQAVRVTRIQRDGSIRTTVHDADPAPHDRKAQLMDDSIVLLPDDIVYVPERIL